MRALVMFPADRPGGVRDQPPGTPPDAAPDRTDSPEFRQRLMSAVRSGDWLAAEASCRQESRFQMIRWLSRAFSAVRR